MDPNETASKRAQARQGLLLRDKWRVDRLLGVGGMATVYAATHINNGKRVAVKILHAELSTNQEVRTRFLREGYVANKVVHPGIVSVLDDDTTEDGAVYLVMELLEGESVGDLLERSGHYLPVKQLVKIADQLLDVLAAAHQAGVVHRDIKPDNLFLTQDATLKVLDFGIARLREISSAQLTLTGAGAMGTPAFMPPEQARGRSELVGPRSDLWAVGATMYTMASGRLVHEAETVNELLLAAMTKPAPPLQSVLPQFPPSLAAVIDRALAFDQEARWPDARSMQAALRQSSASLGIVLGDWGSISGINPIASLAAMAAMASASSSPPRSATPVSVDSPVSAQTPPPRPPSGSAPTHPAYAPSRQSSPEFYLTPTHVLGQARQSVAEMPTLPRPNEPRAAEPPAAPSTPPPSNAEITLPRPMEVMPARNKVGMMTAPAVTVGTWRGTAASSKGLFIAAGIIVGTLAGVGVWAALRGRPVDPGPAVNPPPSVSTEATTRPVEPPPTVEPVQPPTPSTTEPAPSGTGSAGPSVRKTNTVRPPPSAGPKKPSEKDILNRRN